MFISALTRVEKKKLSSRTDKERREAVLRHTHRPTQKRHSNKKIKKLVAS